MINCPSCGANRRKGNSCRKCGRVDLEVLRSIQLPPSINPTSRNNIPPRTPNNSYEKGNRMDERGLPFLDATGSPLKMKESFDRHNYAGNESIRISTGGNS